MKRLGVMILLVMTVEMMFAGGAGQQQGGVTPQSGTADPFAKYEPGITISTVRTMNPSMRFDQNDPDARSLDENRWYRTFQEKLGIQLENKWIAPDAASNTARWNAAMASGDLPDFAVVNDQQYRLLYDAGYMADMGTTFYSYVSPELLKIIPPELFPQMTLDGKLMGFPIPEQAYSGGTELWMRKDWLDKLNLPIPQTFEDVAATAKAFQAAKLGGSDTIGIIFSNIINNNSGMGKLDGAFNAHGAYLDIWLEKNGQAVYSETLPEMRDALLAMQTLYREGVINKDFAAIKSQNALEYLSGGKGGLAYSSTWSVSPAILSLHETNPEADLINILPPPVKGKPARYQTPNPPKPKRVFVNARSRYPEAAVKIANLTWKLQQERYDYYCTDPVTGMYYYRFLPWEDRFVHLLNDMAIADAIRTAELSGTFELPQEILDRYGNSKQLYDTYKLAKEGKYTYTRLKGFGPGGYYTNMYDAYKGNMLVPTVFLGLPTDTMILKGNTLHDELSMVIFDVIMGADISNFDRAVERWKTNGGSQITGEVNAWLRSVRK